MTIVWTSVGVIFAVAATAIAVYAHLRINDQEKAHDHLVDALNEVGAGLNRTPTGYHSNMIAETPLAAEPGDIPTTVHHMPPVHALRDPLVAPAPPVPSGVRDWLLHYSTTPGVSWAGVVEQFYTAAAADPLIKAYFANTDMDRLKKHFTHALIIVTRDGLHRSTVQAMRHAHHGITDAQGNPMHITELVFDRTVDALGVVLNRNGVPDDAIAALADTIAPLREAIVSIA